MAKRLYRSVNNKMIGGVCAGLADYFAIDPVIVRLVAVVLCFADGVGFIAYIVAWMIIPAADAEQEASGKTENSEEKSNWVKYLPGLILIAGGCYFLADQYFYWFDIGELWPLILIIVGVGVIVLSLKRGGQAAADKMESEIDRSKNGESFV